MVKKNNNNWVSFWKNHSIDLDNIDDQTQVARIRNKVPITEEKWEFTVSTVQKQMDLNANDVLLDLGCGNGLFTAKFSALVEKIIAVDINQDLIKKLRSRNLSNVECIFGDIRGVDFPQQSFSKIIWYACIQYLGETEVIWMIQNLYKWLKQGGMLFIGDIPDRSKIWNYFNNNERVHNYFDSLKDGRPLVGTWFDQEWLAKLCNITGFSNAESFSQHDNLIYSDFRFDLIAKR